MNDSSNQPRTASTSPFKEKAIDAAIAKLQDGQLHRAVDMLEDVYDEEQFYPLMSPIYRESFTAVLVKILRMYTGTSRQSEIIRLLRMAGLTVATDLTTYATVRGLTKTNPIYEWRWRATMSPGSLVRHLTDDEIAQLRKYVATRNNYQIRGMTDILVWQALRDTEPKVYTGGVIIECHQSTKVDGVPGKSLRLTGVNLRPIMEGVPVSRSVLRIGRVGIPHLALRRTVTINYDDQIAKGYGPLH